VRLSCAYDALRVSCAILSQVPFSLLFVGLSRVILSRAFPFLSIPRFALPATLCHTCHSLACVLLSYMYHFLSCMIVNHAMCHSLFSLSFSVFLVCVIPALPLACDSNLVRGRDFKVYRYSLECVCASLNCAILTRRPTLPCVILVHASLSLVYHSLSCLILSSCLTLCLSFWLFSCYSLGCVPVQVSLVCQSLTSNHVIPVRTSLPCAILSNIQNDMLSHVPYRMTFSPMCHSFKQIILSHATFSPSVTLGCFQSVFKRAEQKDRYIFSACIKPRVPLLHSTATITRLQCLLLLNSACGIPLRLPLESQGCLPCLYR